MCIFSSFNKHGVCSYYYEKMHPQLQNENFLSTREIQQKDNPLYRCDCCWGGVRYLHVCRFARRRIRHNSSHWLFRCLRSSTIGGRSLIVLVGFRSKEDTPSSGMAINQSNFLGRCDPVVCFPPGLVILSKSCPLGSNRWWQVAALAQVTALPGCDQPIDFSNGFWIKDSHRRFISILSRSSHQSTVHATQSNSTNGGSRRVRWRLV
jgi:hypothetical protein